MWLIYIWGLVILLVSDVMDLKHFPLPTSADLFGCDFSDLLSERDRGRRGRQGNLESRGREGSRRELSCEGLEGEGRANIE